MVYLSVPRTLPFSLDATRHETNRHRAGDTWLIGGKPRDPHDPGPWLWNGDTNYQRDNRTGRHRRGELPDPAPRAAFDAAQVFTRMREEAWTRFLESSEPLAAAHHDPARKGANGNPGDGRWWRVARFLVRALAAILFLRPSKLLNPPVRRRPRPWPEDLRHRQTGPFKLSERSMLPADPSKMSG